MAIKGDKAPAKKTAKKVAEKRSSRKRSSAKAETYKIYIYKVLKQVHPETLESRLLPGLFFAGEVLDLDGPCGGFNLTWAFSSGLLAGPAAAGGEGAALRPLE